ncbi:uncharacterized protein GJ701_016302 isoform 4-T5 [Geothlypis trichas]
MMEVNKAKSGAASRRAAWPQQPHKTPVLTLARASSLGPEGTKTPQEAMGEIPQAVVMKTFGGPDETCEEMSEAEWRCIEAEFERLRRCRRSGSALCCGSWLSWTAPSQLPTPKNPCGWPRGLHSSTDSLGSWRPGACPSPETSIFGCAWVRFRSPALSRSAPGGGSGGTAERRWPRSNNDKEFSMRPRPPGGEQRQT